MRKVIFLLSAFILTILLSSCMMIPRELDSQLNDLGSELNDLGPELSDLGSELGDLGAELDDLILGTEKSSGIAKRDNSSAELTVLFAGTFTVGIDIPPGRYVITADGNGNLFIRDKGTSIVNTILTGGYGRLHPSGVPSITTDLEVGQEIELGGISNATFTPAVTQMSTVLTAGDWVVGLDIPPGIYNAFPTYQEIGNFFIRTAGGRGVVNEILNTTETDRGVERIRVNLEEGQRIQMHNISSVTFEKP